MSLRLLAVVLGRLLIIGAFVLPCLTLLDLAGNGLPYQDPTPEMLRQQAATEAELERELTVHTLIALVVAGAGTALLIYVRRHRPESPDPE